MKMKIYSVGWGWTPTPEDMPVGDSLIKIADNVKALGFDGVDYLSTYESLDEFFTEENCAKLREHCESIGLPIGGLVFQSSAWNNPDEAVTAKQLAYFEKCAKTAQAIGAKTISCIIPGPFGAKGVRGGASPSEKRSANLPDDYSWDEDWKRFYTSLAKACDIAAKYGIRIAMECFPGSLCSTPHAMLKLIEDVNRENFGIQLDTAHLINQHIDPETAVYMLGAKRIFNLHFKDSDGINRGNLPAGWGICDYSAMLRALKNIGYTGSVSIEVEFTDNPKRYMKAALDHVRACENGTF